MQYGVRNFLRMRGKRSWCGRRHYLPLLGEVCDLVKTVLEGDGQCDAPSVRGSPRRSQLIPRVREVELCARDVVGRGPAAGTLCDDVLHPRHDILRSSSRCGYGKATK